MDNNIILSVKDLVVKFTLRGQELTALRGVSMDLYEGESLAVVGESGSGKSVFTKSFIGMLDKNGWIDSGSIIYNGEDIAKFNKDEEWIKIRGKEIAIVFQDPMTSLNPLKTVASQIRESVELHQGLKGAAAKAKVIEILNDVGIADAQRRGKCYPHEFSGGMRQRVVMATALACNPHILICDEPTTALDVTIQAQILELLKKLQKKYKLTIIYITHDLGVVANVADRVAVMYAGDIVEIGTCEEVFYTPKHPYTWALLSSLPQLGVKGKPLYSIAGTPPNLFTEIKGDAFAPRNRYAMEIDYIKRPPFFDVSPTHKARTWLLDPRAPYVEPPNISIPKTQTKNGGKKKDISEEKLVQVKNLSVHFGSAKKPFVAVKNATFDIYKGETFGLVGESGSGKTSIGRAIIRINAVSEGEILYKGKRISGKIDRTTDHMITQKIQMIFQDPMASLNDRAKVDYIVSEGLINVRPDISEEERKQKVAETLQAVGLLPEFSSRFPHEFSGGQRQRIGIARSLIMEPEFIIADEPISALDVSIRAQVLNLMASLQKERGLTYMFISHDLSVMRFIADRIAVIHKGVIVELAETEELFSHPLHPYTKALLSAIPLPDPASEKKKVLQVYDPLCHDYSIDKPSWIEINPSHCILANKVELEKYQKMMICHEY